LQAFDELEMLIESLDNACNLEKMHMWPDVLSCLDPKESEQVARFALWIIGTAAQNNPEVQRDLLSRHDIVTRVLAAWSEESRELRAKALYALTALVSNNPLALEAFVVAGGFKLLEERLPEPADQSRLLEKASFLLRVLGNEIGPDAVFCLLEGCIRLRGLFQDRQEEN
jgi:hsp70-interacting protein